MEIVKAVTDILKEHIEYVGLHINKLKKQSNDWKN